MSQSLQDILASDTLRIALVYFLGPAFVIAIFAFGKPLQMLTIARNTFVESVRQPIYFILIMVSGIFQVLNVWGSAYSMGYTESAEVSGDNKLLLDVGLATIFVCGTLLAAFISTAVISREIENKTVLTVVSKPISRTAVVLGKYLGVAAAVTIAAVTMVMFLQMGIRHGVLSTAADELDMPVVLISAIAVFLAVGVAIWCNFFYGWVFTQTATMLLCPFMIIAWLLIMPINKHWELQPLLTNFKPQVTLACISVVFALLVLTSISTAASARLGQVMTIVVCSGLFVFGLLSNHFVGSRAFENTFVAKFEKVSPERSDQAELFNSGDSYNVQFLFEPTAKIAVGMPAYFSANPNGFPMSTYAFTAPDPLKYDFSKPDTPHLKGLEPALVFSKVAGRNATITHVGPDAKLLRFPPMPDDFVFVTPTRIHPVAVAAWGVIPNVQFFWLVDAVTQNQPVPASHLVLIIFYAIAQIGIFLSLAVILFQTREVG
ncbi:MAG: ABC transporter permease subunit [Pyrinomonadaceae bacterium]|nr:ABC transporter permease subunit [Phycisphaerales bacterium]